MEKPPSIENFIEANRSRSKKVKAAIIERWNTRVVPRELDKLGKQGANIYLDSYGNNISTAKVIELALCGESMGAVELATGFWEAAYRLEFGDSAEIKSFDLISSDPLLSVDTVNINKIVLMGIPELLQPGHISTMQPKDSDQPQSSYIEDPEFIGQAKRDGHRNILFATKEATAHQSRTTTAMPILHPHFEAAAKAAAADIGPFILDGERYFLSVVGSEHRTAAQAATINVSNGKGSVQPLPTYAAFKSLYFQNNDLRLATEKQRIEAASIIVPIIQAHLPIGSMLIELLATAFTFNEKNALVNRQQTENREGEVWTKINCLYSAGKGHKDCFRTKYIDTDVFTIIAIAKSSSSDRVISSFELADSSGRSVGSVGTGFTDQIALEILEAHQKSPHSVKIMVQFQGYTEKGSLWHARFLEVFKELKGK